MCQSCVSKLVTDEVQNKSLDVSILYAIGDQKAKKKMFLLSIKFDILTGRQGTALSLNYCKHTKVEETG